MRAGPPVCDRGAEMTVEFPSDEAGRQRALDRYDVLDTPPEEAFERIVRLAAHVFEVPIALVTLVDRGRQWFKARYGLSLAETARDISFCAHTILSEDTLVVEDASLDPRFAGNPMVKGDPFVRFYAGAPLVTPDGHRIGSLAILDRKTRGLDARGQALLREISQFAIEGLETRLRDATTARRRLAETATEAQRALERFDLVARATNDVVWDWDLTTDRVWWSPSLTTLLGYSQSEVGDKNAWIERIHPDDRMKSAASIEEAVAAGRSSWVAEYRFRRKDGSWAEIYDRGYVIRDGNRPVRTIGAMMDQTARKSSEGARAALYRIAEAASASQSLEEMLGAIHGIIGELMHAPNLYVALHDPRSGMLEFPYWADERDPPSGPGPLGHGLTEYVLRKGEPVLVPNRASFEVLVKKGEVEQVGTPSLSWLGIPLCAHEITFGVLAAQIYEGDVRYGDRERDLLQFVSRQVSHAIERKRTEESIRASERRFRALIEHSADGISLLGPDWEVTYRSPSARRILQGDSDGPGRLFENIHPDDLPSYQHAVEELARSPGIPIRMSFRVRRGDGVYRQIESTGTNLLQDPAVGSVVVNFRDVTERSEMEGRLMMADRMVSVGTLAAGVAHEINNPLAYVIANLGYVAEVLSAQSPHPSASTLDALREAQDGAERVRKIVQDLKTFSRGGEERTGPVDLRGVLEASSNLAWNEVRHRAKLVKDYAADLPQVRGNESRLAQVFLNLIINAAQAMPIGAADDHQIRIATRAAGGKVEVKITDTGAGIPSSDLRRIFDPFFTTKPTGEGTGLGLFICQNIVRSYGGRIAVESQLGVGSVFTVELPAATAEQQDPVVSEAPRSTGRRGRVLVVDDESNVIAALRRMLGAHEVIAESEAEIALDRIRKGERYDVILCDLMMPRLSGMDFHAALAQEAPDQAARIVFMTGGAFTPSARQFLDQVPNRHVAKPFEMQELRALIDDRVAAAG